MHMVCSFTDLNWLPIIVATVLAFAIGGLWYSPVLFSKIWQRELAMDPEKMKSPNMPLIFGLAFLLNFISAIFLEMLIGKQSTFCHGLSVGFTVSLVFVSTALGIIYLFSQKSLKLFLIDAGYFVVYYSVMGGLLGAWN